MKMYRVILKWTKGRLPGRRETEENLRLLFMGQEIASQEEKYYTEKIRLVFGVMLAGLCMAVFSAVSSAGNAYLTDGYFLPRQKAAYQIELELQTEDEKERDVEVYVEPQRMTAEESRALLKQISEQIGTYILGDNRSLEEVRSDLKLIRQIEGTPVTITWELDSYKVLNLDGSIREENLTEEGTLVELTAVLSCYEEQEVCRICAKLLPPIPGKEESFRRDLQEEIGRLQEESQEEEKQELPAMIQGEKLVWKERTSGHSALLVLFTLICAALVYTAKDRELKQKVKERELQMKRDYVRIVSKLVLLLGAGATIRSAWELVVREYLTKREAGSEEFRYAYEEMALTVHEMQNGIAEAKAYENFGLRCRIPCYLKLSALLEQNLSKGSSGLLQLLGAEIQEAFEQRKELARCQGEETSTRLLLPMILMLVVVMLIILVPAGMSMHI